MPLTVTDGRARSRLIPVTATVAAPPLVAVTVRLTDCAARFAVNCTAVGQDFVSGAPCAVQWKVTVTAVRYQPALDLGRALVTVAVIDGSEREVEAEEAVNEVPPE